jgi:hypothetical protein
MLNGELYLNIIDQFITAAAVFRLKVRLGTLILMANSGRIIHKSIHEETVNAIQNLSQKI